MPASPSVTSAMPSTDSANISSDAEPATEFARPDAEPSGLRLVTLRYRHKAQQRIEPPVLRPRSTPMRAARWNQPLAIARSPRSTR